MSLMTFVSLSLLLADIRQDAHHLIKVGHQAVDAGSSHMNAIQSEPCAQHRLALDVTAASGALQLKLSALSSRVVELDDIEEAELDAALRLVSSVTVQFAGQVEYIQTDLDINSNPETDTLDRGVLDSIVKVRNDFEDLYILLKQFKEDEPLESGAFFSSRDEALAVSIKGLVALGISPEVANQMVH